MTSYNYPIYLSLSENGLQYWVDPHSIIVMNGGNGSKSAGNGSASLGKQISIEKNGSCVVVVEVVGGPLYTHSLEYECSYLYLMIKGIFH